MRLIRVSAVALSLIAVLLLPMTTNIAAGALPGSWKPYLWLAWPLAGLLCLPLVVVEVRRRWSGRQREASPLVLPSGRDSAVWSIPGGSRFFVGRAEPMRRLRFAAERPERGVTVLTGMPGVGKTELACAFGAARRGGYDIGWWVAAENRVAVLTSLAQLADRLGVGHEDQEIAARRAVHELDRRERWLLVLDDVSREQDVAGLIPSGGGQVIITSRDPELGRLGHAIKVEPLDDEASAKLLIARTGGKDLAAAAELGRELGGLPLALEQAAAYCRIAGVSVAGYLPRYRQNRTRLLREGNRSDMVPVQATLSLAIAQASRRDRAAVDLLRLCSFLAPAAAIPRWLIESDPALLPGRLSRAAEDVFALDATVGVLVRLSLLQADDDLLRIHPVVQDVIRDRIARGRRVRSLRRSGPARRVAWWVRTAAEVLLAALPGDVDDPATWERWVLAVPHCTWVVRHATALSVTGEPVARLRHRIGAYLLSRGDYLHARPLLDSARKEYQETLGYEDRATLTAMNDYARLLVEQGELDDGLQLHEAILATRHRVLGTRHRDTLISMNNRAFVLDRLGRTSEALLLHDQVLRIRQESLGEEHPDTLISKGNLALVLAGQGDLRRAGELHAQSHAVRRKVLGAEHPVTLAAMNNWAIVVGQLGNPEAALRMHDEVLSVRLRAYGPEHPETLVSMNNKGFVLARLGRLEEAHALLDPAVRDRERLFGRDHPHTLMSRNNLAMVIGAEGHHEDAIRRHEEILRARLRIHSAQHFHTLHSQNNLAVALAAAGQWDRAGVLHEQTLRVRRRVLGPEHPCTLNSMHNLALVRAAEGLVDTASELLETTLKVRVGLLGPEHPYTRNTEQCLTRLEPGTYDAAGAEPT